MMTIVVTPTGQPPVDTTAHGVMIGRGANQSTTNNAVVLTDFQVLMGQLNADPIPMTLVQGSNVTINFDTGAHTITISSTGGGGGGGDLLAANNLSDLDNISTARTNLGLGSAALANSTDFASASDFSALSSTVSGISTDLTTAEGNIATNTSDIASLNSALANYLTITDAASTYLTITDAASTYLDLTTAASTYLTISNASSTYLTQSGAAITYLTISTAASTYATQSSLTSGLAGKQPLDATLTSISGLGTAADKIAYTTGVDTWAETSLTSFGRSLISGTVVNQTGTTVTLAAQNIYIMNAATLITATLPATAAVGDTFVILGCGAGGYKINVATGQTINVGSNPTTTSTGSVASTNQFDCITITCVVENTTFVAYGLQGSLTVA